MKKRTTLSINIFLRSLLVVVFTAIVAVLPSPLFAIIYNTGDVANDANLEPPGFSNIEIIEFQDIGTNQRSFLQYVTGGAGKVKLYSAPSATTGGPAGGTAWLGIGKDPTAELDTAGTVKATGFTFPTGAAANKVLTTADTNGGFFWSGLESILQTLAGYNGTTNQVLKNDNGTISWGAVGLVTEADPIFAAQKGVASGVATLGADGKVPSSELPKLVVTDVLVQPLSAVDTAAERAVLGIEQGDVIIDVGTNKTYIWDGAVWQEIIASNVVTSVNGKTGTVVLSLNDLNNVAISSLVADQILQWNGTAWVNTALPVSSQWTDVTGGIKYTVGNVGIGAAITDLPFPLTVKGDVAAGGFVTAGTVSADSGVFTRGGNIVAQSVFSNNFKYVAGERTLIYGTPRCNTIGTGGKLNCDISNTLLDCGSGNYNIGTDPGSAPPVCYDQYLSIENAPAKQAYTLVSSETTGGWVTGNTGFGDTISIGGDSGLTVPDAEIRINAPSNRNLVSFTNPGVTGGLADIRAKKGFFESLFVAGAGADGQILTYDSATQSVVWRNPGSGADNWGTQVVEHDASLQGSGTTASKLGLMACSATGQILKWDNTALTWSCVADASQWADVPAIPGAISYSGGKVGINRSDRLSTFTVKGQNSFSYPTAVNITGGTSISGSGFLSRIGIGDRVLLNYPGTIANNEAIVNALTDTSLTVSVVAPPGDTTLDIQNAVPMTVYPAIARFDDASGDQKIVINDKGTLIANTAQTGFLGTAGFALVDGSQGLDKVLTSNASGVASWQLPAPGYTDTNVAGWVDNNLLDKTLASGGQILGNLLPDLVITDTYPVSDGADADTNCDNEIIALSNTKRGDVAICATMNTSYILSTDTPGTFSNWIKLLALDSDADSTNELQNLSLGADGKTLTISRVSGTGASVTVNTDDADANPTNEAQTLRLDASSRQVTLSPVGTAGGGGFTLPPPGISEYEVSKSDFNAPLTSGFYQANDNPDTTAEEPTGDVPDISHPWSHLIVSRHSNTANNHQLQIAASYNDNDRLFFRKIKGNSPSWNEVATRGANSFTGDQIITGNVGIGTADTSAAQLTVEKNILINPNSAQAVGLAVFNGVRIAAGDEYLAITTTSAEPTFYVKGGNVGAWTQYPSASLTTRAKAEQTGSGSITIGAASGGQTILTSSESWIRPNIGLLVSYASNISLDSCSPGGTVLQERTTVASIDDATNQIILDPETQFSNVSTNCTYSVTFKRVQDAFVAEDSSGVPMFIINASGNVGIGDTVPVEKLSIGGTGSTIELGADVAGKETNAGKIGYQKFTSDALDIVGAGTSGSNRKIKFWNEGGATFTGNVGIGAAAPLDPLEVVGVSGAYSGAGNESIFQITTGTGLTTDNKLQFGIVNDDYAWIQSVDPGNVVRNLVLNPGGGSVGIGTSNPASDSKLHVFTSSGNAFGRMESDNGAAGIILDRSAATGYAGVYYQTAGANKWFAGTWGNDKYSIVGRASTGEPSRFVIDTNGNVGIGNATPAALLTVGDGGKFKVDSSGHITTSGRLRVNGNNDGTSWAVGVTGSSIFQGNVNINGKINGTARGVGIYHQCGIYGSITFDARCTDSDAAEYGNNNPVAGYLITP